MSQRPNPPFPRIANCYGSRLHADSSEADIAQWARYDLLIGGIQMPGTDEDVARFEKVLARLAELNPHMIATCFVSSAPYIHAHQNPDFPDDGYLKTAAGDRIDGWPGTTMINLTRDDVVEYMAQLSAKPFRRYGIQTFVDCMGPGFDNWACNIATGVDYTLDADEDGEADDATELNRRWAEGKRRLAARIRELIGDDAIFMDNQGGRETAGALNGILLEDYIDYTVDRHAPSYPMEWRHVLDTYLWWCEHCRVPNVTTLQASSGIQPPFEMWKSMAAVGRAELFDRGRSLLRRMRYGLCTALMGNGYWSYDLHTRARGQDWWYAEYDVPLGYPVGTAEERPDGAWQRAFDAPGLVVVNPTDAPVVVELDGRHRDASFGIVSRECTVLPRDGAILLPM